MSPLHGRPIIPWLAAPVQPEPGPLDWPGGFVLDEELLRILACPLCIAPLTETGERLVCQQCGRRYPIRHGIPVLLLDEAELPGGERQGGAASDA